MCVIAIKPKGVDMPSETWIENMWWANHDGAGFMYATGKKVIINKGYMELNDFNKAIAELGAERNLKDTALIMHFRIGTAGGNIPANTHPFPISDSIPVLQKLTCATQLGIVHNGIIPVTPRQKDISDTMEYIASTLAPLYRYDNEFYRSKELLQMIGNQTASKLAFMNPKGEIFTVGSFIEDKGLLFSNASYNSVLYYRRTPVRVYGMDDYDDLYDDWYYNLDRGEYIEDLMLLDNGEYIINMTTGDFIDCDSEIFFVDEDGFLYVYSDIDQVAYPVSGDYQVFNKEGLPVKYVEDKAATMIVCDCDTDINLFSEEWIDEDSKDDNGMEKNKKDTLPF